MKLAITTTQQIKIFLTTPAGKIAFDVVKFFLVYFLLAALTGILFLLFIKSSLDPYYMKSEDIMTNIDAMTNEDMDFNKTLEISTTVGKISPVIPFVLSFFAVFFDRPPKTLKHLCLTTFFICLICSLPLFLEPIYVAINFAIFYVSALFVWLFSVVWFKIQTHRTRDKKNTSP